LIYGTAQKIKATNTLQALLCDAFFAPRWSASRPAVVHWPAPPG